MKGRSIRVTSEAHWKELRSQHLGGSDLGSVLGVNPTKSRLELWAEKAHKIEPKTFETDERVYFGKLLEPVIAKAVADRTGWTVKNVKRYISGLPEIRLGATLDREVFCPDRGWGVLELKTVDYSIFKKWDAEDGCQISYQIQLQVYLGLTGRSWGAIAVLVGGNRLEIYEYEAKPGLFELICEATEAFWDSIERDEPPLPDFEKDARLIGLMSRTVALGKEIDLPADGREAELASLYLNAAITAAEAEAQKTKARSELIHLLGDAEIARAGNFQITSSVVAGKPDWHVSLSDLGRVVKGRSSFRTIHIKEKK